MINEIKRKSLKERNFREQDVKNDDDDEVERRREGREGEGGTEGKKKRERE